MTMVEDDELEREALAAGSPDQVVPEGAVPFGATQGGTDGVELLPAWYMPAPAAGSRKRSHRIMAWAFIGALITVNLSGLCITYGHLVIA